MGNDRQGGSFLAGPGAAILCYLMWGAAPLYWKLLGEVHSFEVIAQRLIWSFALMALICAVMRINYLRYFKDKRAMAYLLPAAIFVLLNWSIYIYAVDAGHVVDTALGYYINPLLSILLGVVFFKERLSTLQKIAVALCFAGVLYFTIDYGILPWISLSLAGLFAIYGAIKKKGGYPAIPALAVECTITLPIGFAIAFAIASLTGTHAFLADTGSAHGWYLTLLLIGAGPVTAIPLVLFAQAANNTSLSTLGFIQYLSPTIALLLGVFAFGEPFTQAHAVCFGCIWAGLALVSFETIRGTKKSAANCEHEAERPEESTERASVELEEPSEQHA